MESILRSFEGLDEGRRKRVRQALASGDRKTARQELTEAGFASDEDIEAYLHHLDEEQKRVQACLLEEAQLREKQDEEELLLLAMDALKLEDKAVSCPRCSKANVSFIDQVIVECPNCKLSIRWQGSLEEFREYLAESFVDHANTKCQNTRPLVDASLPSKKLFMHCLDCDWTRLVSHA